MNLKPILCFAVLIVFASCKKSDNETAETIPDPVLFRVASVDKLANIANADLYWYESGVKHSENDNTDNLDTRPFHLYYPITSFDTISLIATYDSSRPLLFSSGLVAISGRKNVNTFYISYGNGGVDTLNVTTDRVATPNGHKYKLGSISQHGNVLNMDSSYRYETYPVYDLR